ncbi:MAG TPA: hypothetical protein VM370_13795 [Candidatus Thermoplasmatota archaeon]|nr:hypothetical protein [Candidatus Thermoplasmatota archaeon]
MNIRVEHDSPVPPAKVQEYFFDLREDDHQRGNHAHILGARPGDYRKILSHNATEVRAEDGYRGGKNKVAFVLRKSGTNAIDYDVTGAWYDSKGRLQADPNGPGSHITFASGATWKVFLPKLLMGRMLQGIITKDMQEHLRLMDEDWAKHPW